MLSPTEIRPAVEAVLLATDNALSSYQILDRLPSELRDRIIAERGWPGAGSGNSYSAASLVTDAVEGLLPSMDPPYRTYIDTGNATFEVAEKTITAGNSAIAFYRLPKTETIQIAATANIENTSSQISKSTNTQSIKVKSEKKKSYWFVILAIVFYPIGFCYLIYLGIKKIWHHPTWLRKTKVILLSLISLVFVMPSIFGWLQIIQQDKGEKAARAEQEKNAAIVEAQRDSAQRAKQEEIARLQATPKGKAQLAAERLRRDAETKRQAQIQSQHATERSKDQKSLTSTNDYIGRVKGDISMITAGYERIVGLLKEYKNDSTISSTEEWRSEWALAAVAMISAGKDLEQSQEVPEMFQQVQTNLTKIGRLSQSAANDSTEAIEHSDQDKLDTAAASINTMTDLLDAVNHQLDEIKSGIYK